MTTTSLGAFVPTLQQALASLKSSASVEQWGSVEGACKGIADGLRTRNGPGAHIHERDWTRTHFGSSFTVDNHTALGQSQLPEVLTELLGRATSASDAGNGGAAKSGIPSSPASAAATYEILRVGANLCMDHGESSCLGSSMPSQ